MEINKLYGKFIQNKHNCPHTIPYPHENIPNYIDGVLILGGPSSAKLTIDYNQVSFNEAGERLIYALYAVGHRWIMTSDD